MAPPPCFATSQEGQKLASQGRESAMCLCLVKEEQPCAVVLNLICSASVISVTGDFKCWIGELFLGKVFQRAGITREQRKSQWCSSQVRPSQPSVHKLS